MKTQAFQLISRQDIRVRKVVLSQTWVQRVFVSKKKYRRKGANRWAEDRGED